jgi:hypothetical protein
MLTAVWRATFVCRSLRRDGTCNEVGTYTLVMQCSISFKQWENRDVLGPSGISLMPNWISHVSSQQLQFVSLLLDKCCASRKGVFWRSDSTVIAISGVPNQHLNWSHLYGFRNGIWFIIDAVLSIHCSLFQAFPAIVRLTSYSEFPSQ